MELTTKQQASLDRAYANLCGADHLTVFPEQLGAVHQAMRILAGMDADRATAENHKGFSKSHTVPGHILAGLDILNERNAVLAQDFVRHYRSQLPAMIVATALGEQKPYVYVPNGKSAAEMFGDFYAATKAKHAAAEVTKSAVALVPVAAPEHSKAQLEALKAAIRKLSTNTDTITPTSP
jgi:hypothetical protein